LWWTADPCLSVATTGRPGERQDKMKHQSEVIYPGYEGVARMSAISELQRKSLSGEQVAVRLRQIFTLVVQLPDELVASFASDHVDERRDQLMKRVFEVHSSMEPVLEWIERRRVPGSSSPLEDELKWVFCEVVDCATHEIPEYAGGAPKPFHIGDPSAGWRRAHNLDLRIQRLAVSLIAWARDIESDLRTREPECTSPPTSRKASKSGRKATVNVRMLEAIQENPEAMGWNSPKWAKFLKCVKSSVVETKTWKGLSTSRERERAERALDRRRKPRASELRRD
jgi:hypothetical protein